MAAPTNSTAWPTGPIASVRRCLGRGRSWFCRNTCNCCYDHQAGRIVDGALAEVDRLKQEVATLREQSAQAQGTEPW